METQYFVDHTVETAPLGARASLAASQRSFGFVPAALARMAESPPLVEAFEAGLRQFARSVLTPLEREVVVLTLARVVGCDVCVAIHTATLAQLHAAPELVSALRAQTPLADPRLEALRRFTRAVIDARGDVPPASFEDFLAAGYTRRHALDVVLGVGVYTLSTFANRMTRAPLDAPLAAFR